MWLHVSITPHRKKEKKKKKHDAYKLDLRCIIVCMQVTILFDVVLVVQHYLVYPRAAAPNASVVRSD